MSTINYSRITPDIRDSRLAHLLRLVSQARAMLVEVHEHIISGTKFDALGMANNGRER